MNDLWLYNIESNTWTWMKGSSTGNQPPDYGTKGIPAATNTPGGRMDCNAWIDTGNNLYLFGGRGSNSNNDLWKYTPADNIWTWINGDSLPYQPPVWGTQGVSHPQNKPGARAAGLSFTDLQGNFWLFGGLGMSSLNTNGGLNDLWKYSPVTNQWAWMKGSELNAYGIYGTRGVPNVVNRPGSRWGAMSWSSPSSDFWLFGGNGYAETTGPGEMNDLWNINSSSVLPIRLISFNGKMHQGNIQLQWQAEEVNSSDFFVVERSEDGRNFSSVGNVAATPLQKNYTFNDNSNLNTTTVFYRIKVVEQGNRFFYSKILRFSLPNNVVTIYPNPAKSHIWVVLPSAETTNGSYKVVDATGRTSLRGNFVTTASNRHSIDVSKLSPGNYTIAIITKKGTTQASFIKQ